MFLLRTIIIVIVSLFPLQLVLAGDRALLIGIQKYKHRVLKPGMVGISDIEGAANDVSSMAAVLRDNWGLNGKDIVTLVNKDATRENILTEIDRLQSTTTSGDRVFIYYSGHGTSALDPDNPTLSRLLPHDSGAILPWDMPIGVPIEKVHEQLVIGRRDLRPRLERLDQSGREVLVIFDTCHSGNAVRSAASFEQASLPTRYTDLESLVGSTRGTSDILDDSEICVFDCPKSSNSQYPYKNIAYLAASSETEKAKDIGSKWLSRYPTIDGKPHGAFTDGLLRAMKGKIHADFNGDGSLSVSELKHSISCFINKRNYQQSPQMLPTLLDGESNVVNRAVFNSITSSARNNSSQIKVFDETGMVSSNKNITVVDNNSKRNGFEIHIVRNGNKLNISNSSGDKIVSINADEEQKLLQVIATEHWLKGMVQDECSARSFDVSLQVSDAGKGNVVPVNKSIKLTFGAEKPSYLLLLTVNPFGRIETLYPVNNSELDLVEAFEKVRFPQGGQKITAVPPTGRERLILLAFTGAKQPTFIHKLMGKETNIKSPEIQEMKKYIENNSDKVGYISADLLVID